MKTNPIYIRSLFISNVKSFGQGVEIKFEKKDGTLPQWTLILGDNGIGKTTLLQCIAWMKPLLPYDVDEIPKGWKPTPLIDNEENEVLEKIVRTTKGQTRNAQISASFIAQSELRKVIDKKNKNYCQTFMEIGLDAKGKLELVNPEFKTSNKDIFYSDEVLIFAYSASRKLGKLNLANPGLLDPLPDFIKEDTELYDAEEILHALNYVKLGSNNEVEKKKYSDFIEEVRKMLVDVLPDFEDTDNIIILPPKVLSKDPDGGIMIKTKHGEKLPFSNLSLGYKTVTSWTIDLAWRLFNKYQSKSSNPLKEPAIVLIDEIDLHLHPIWQREIMDNLSRNFPNVQFIATAHSPLMVQAAIESNFSVLKHEKDGVFVVSEPAGIDGWRIDQILTSELFGLESARGLRYEQLMEERRLLIGKVKLTKKDQSELQKIENELSNLPSGETPEDISNREIIARTVSKIRNGDIKIKL